jgi:hypothetical protein
VDVAIKKVGQREGQDRFVLVSVKTRKIVTVHDATARSLQRFFVQRGASRELIEQCLQRARERYAHDRKPARPAVNDAAETIEDDSLLFELGLDGDDDANE